MAGSHAQALFHAEGAHLVLYDGACGLCSRFLRFLLAHDGRAVFKYSSLQSATGRAMVQRYGGNPFDLTSFYVIANYRTSDARVFTRSAAALFVEGELGWPWKAARAAGLLPKIVLDRAYDLVARSRYRLFDRHEQCPMPRPEFRNRFID